MSKRCKQAGEKKKEKSSVKNLAKDVSGADNSPFAGNNLTTGTAILPGQASSSLSKITREAPKSCKTTGSHTSSCAGMLAYCIVSSIKRSRPAKCHRHTIYLREHQNEKYRESETEPE